MARVGAALRVAVVVGSALAAAGSAAKQPLQASYFTKAQPPPHGCEDACARVSACDIEPFEACVTRCRQEGTEQQAGGPQRLDVIAKANCEDIAAPLPAAPPHPSP